MFRDKEDKLRIIQTLKDKKISSVKGSGPVTILTFTQNKENILSNHCLDENEFELTAKFNVVDEKETAV
jgi:hypothetical protein